MMKIAYFSYLFDIKGVSAGSANKAIGFMDGLRQLGHETRIFWRGYQPPEDKREAYERRQNSSLKRTLRKYLNEPKCLLMNAKHLVQENKILKEMNPDVVISRFTLYGFSSLALCKSRKIPFVIEADNPPIYENNSFYGKENIHLDRIAKTIEQKNLMQADAIIVLSNILKDFFVSKGVHENKMFVIPNGADPDKFYPRLRDDFLVEKFNLKGKRVIGWIGSLDGGWQGLENLVKMTQNVLSQQEDIVFMYVGGAKNKQRFQDLIEETGFNDRVILPGLVPYIEIPRYLSVMDIVIAPYPKLDFWYPSSMKIFEYMGCGKAVVASGVGQINEVIEDGVNGSLFDPDIKDDLTKKVLSLARKPDLCRLLGANAHKTVLQKYTWKHHAKKMEDIFFHLLKDRGKENRV